MSAAAIKAGSSVQVNTVTPEVREGTSRTLNFISNLTMRVFQESSKTSEQSTLVAGTSLAASVIMLCAGMSNPTEKQKVMNLIMHGNTEVSAKERGSSLTLRDIAGEVNAMTAQLRCSGAAPQPSSALVNCIAVGAGNIKADFNTFMSEMGARTFSPKERDQVIPWMSSHAPSSLAPTVESLVKASEAFRDPATTALLSCTIFQATWQDRFNPARTSDDYFIGPTNKVHRMRLMSLREDVRLGFNDGHTVICLPYVGNENFKFYAIQPHDPKRIKETESRFYELMQKTRLINTPAELFMPRLRLRSKEDRLKLFESAKILSSSVALEGIAKGATLNSFEEQVSGEVDEEGTKFVALASQGIPMCVAGYNPAIPQRISIITPYVWCVAKKVDDCALILLAGSIKDDRFLVPGSLEPHRQGFTRVENSLKGVEEMLKTDRNWGVIKEAVAKYTQGAPIRYTSYTLSVSNSPIPNSNALNTFNILNYSNQSVEFTYLGDMLLNGTHVRYKPSGERYARPLRFGPHDTNLIVFEHQGDVYYLEKRLESSDCLRVRVASDDVAVGVRIDTIGNSISVVFPTLVPLQF